MTVDICNLLTAVAADPADTMPLLTPAPAAADAPVTPITSASTSTTLAPAGIKRKFESDQSGHPAEPALEASVISTLGAPTPPVVPGPAASATPLLALTHTLPTSTAAPAAEVVDTYLEVQFVLYVSNIAF